MNLNFRVLGDWPNTYAFTKAVAEQIVQTRSGNLPIGVFRPAIGKFYYSINYTGAYT